ncbi:hypothetical protein ACF1AE_19190 [Streptomyces sp. NPDC014986]
MYLGPLAQGGEPGCALGDAGEVLNDTVCGEQVSRDDPLVR